MSLKIDDMLNLSALIFLYELLVKSCLLNYYIESIAFQMRFPSGVPFTPTYAGNVAACLQLIKFGCLL